MEKFLLPKLTWLIYLISASMIAQEYAVFEANGSPAINSGTKNELLKKGSVILNGTIQINANDNLLLLSEKGDLYQLDKAGAYPYEMIVNHKKSISDEGLSTKYFSYVWKQITNADKTKNHTGNVYRDGLIDILLTPKDSTSLYSFKADFKWKAEQNVSHYYFFLRNIYTNELNKFKVEGNTFSLYENKHLLSKGNEYLWGVSKEEFPDFTRMKLNHFLYLSRDQYYTILNEHSKLNKQLNELGLSEAQISQNFCEFLNLCTN